MNILLKIGAILTLIVAEVHSLNILGVFPYQGKSHFYVFEPYLRELTRRGHNVTVISHFPMDIPVSNYRDVSLAGKSKIYEDVMKLHRSYKSIIGIGFFLTDSGNDNCRTMLADENVQQLWKSKTKFDVVVVELFNSDCGLGLAHQLGAPVVGITSHNFMPWHYNRFGIPYNPAYVLPQFLEGGTKPTLYQRVERTIIDFYFRNLFAFLSQRVDEGTLRQYFDDVPPLEDLAKEIKVLLWYMHFSLTGSILLPPSVVEVNGYHVEKPKPLPDDIKKFIDESKDGVIYMNFGSMLKATSMPRDKLEAIFGALAELPQRVIFKWEEQTLPGNPKNVFVSKWLPQNDILAHPKVLAFYSHCGMLGTTEAIYHGVPIVGMPIFGDQPSNAAAMENSGMGVQIAISELTKENLLKKLKTVLDPKFREQVKRTSKIWHDRPMSPMDTAIYWTEFVGRNQNYTFKPPTMDLPYYQFLNLDIIAVFVVFILVIVFVIKSILALLCGKKTSKVNSGKRKTKKVE